MTASSNFPCSNCGAQLTYSPGALTLTCPSCGTENEIPPLPGSGPWGGEAIRELDYHKALADMLAPHEVEETQTLACPSCGAEVAFDAGVLADECPFCATPLAKEAAHSHRHPKPQAVLPFAVPEREARGKLRDWLGSLWFAPNGLKKYAESGRPIAGVYVPHYTYDAEGSARYQGARGDAYYVTRTRTVMVDGKPQQQTYQERRIRWTSVSGHVRRFFDDVLVPASDTMGATADRAENGGRSWDLAGLEPFRAEYLAGFRAEAPSVELEQGFARAEQTMESILRRDVRFDIGGDEQRITHMATRYDRITFKHVLLPVWLAAYRWKNKPFRVVINGRTGAVSGERPYSIWKITLAVIAGICVAAAIGYLFAQQQGMG
ncbi:primosomal protein N' (replication factor Y) - superfamily II helicase [Rhodobacteraceae bacterium NNCM2]|nr:primosomal protein N' (replication factor Y) - superfamily II helicase [Coraliihabitans acroporae]